LKGFGDGGKGYEALDRGKRPEEQRRAIIDGDRKRHGKDLERERQRWHLVRECIVERRNRTPPSCAICVAVVPTESKENSHSTSSNLQ
jgi:hypothetical protein